MPISEPIAPGYPMHNAEKQRMATMINMITPKGVPWSVMCPLDIEFLSEESPSIIFCVR